MPLEPLLAVDDLAAYLGVSRRFIYRLTHERRIAFTRAGGQLRFTESAVAACLAREETAAAPREAPDQTLYSAPQTASAQHPSVPA